MDVSILMLSTALVIFLLWKGITILNAHKEYHGLFSSKNILYIGKRHPLWGHLHLMSQISDYIRLVNEGIQKTEKKIFACWLLFFYPVFTLCHPETAKVILETSEPKPLQIGSGYFAFIPWLGEGLILQSGKKWERNRRLLSKAFHFDALKSYVKTFNEVVDVLLVNMDNLGSDGKGVELNEPIRMATLDTILRCALSFDENIQGEGSGHPYVKAVKNIIALAGVRMVKPWLYPEVFFRLSAEGARFYQHVKFVHDFDESVINDRRKAMAADPSLLRRRRPDFLEILLSARDEHGTGLTDREIRDEVDTFLSAGYETSAAVISWAIYSCSRHPEEQQRIYEEVIEVLGDRRHVEWSDIQEMSRLSVFLKESMRMYTPVSVIARRTTREYTMDGTTLPANSDVIISLVSLNHRKDVWTDPETFRPGRFSEDLDKNPFSFVPFSAGPRNCIGQSFAMNEVKVAIARIIQEFKILPDLDHETIPCQEAIISSKSGIWVKLEKRH